MDHSQDKQTNAMPWRRSLSQRAEMRIYRGALQRLGHTGGGTKQWAHVDYLGRLIEGEAHLRRDRATQNRVRQARFPVIKTLDQFRWDWPTQINRLQVQHHFSLGFIKDKANLIYLGGVGVGKTHLATALGYTACLQGYAVLFASAIDVINTLAAAKVRAVSSRNSKDTPNRRCSFSMNLATSPLTSRGRSPLQEIISLRYEQGSIMLTSNRAFKEWPRMFNNDSTLTAAILDRLLHHAETVVIEGKSFRMRGQIEP